MHLTIKQHAKRRDSKVLQFHMRVPDAVRERVRGRVITVDLPPHGSEPGAVFEAKLGSSCGARCTPAIRTPPTLGIC